LALIDLEGYPTTSVITPSKADGIKTVYFCTQHTGDKPGRLAKCKRASVCFGSGEYGISLVGEIEILTGAAAKKDAWYEALEGHFPKGCTDPDYCVLKFTTKRYNLFVDWKEVKGKI
jgi:general stress protein 26